VLRDRDADGSSATGGLGLSASGLESRLYCLQDPSWNVTVIADDNGDIQERAAYGAFGKPAFLTPTYGTRSATSYDWETLFAAYRFDGESGQCHVRNRTLLLSLGRWGQRDRLGFGAAPELQLYSYVGNRPLRATDPYGYQEKESGKVDLGNLDLATHAGIVEAVSKPGQDSKRTGQLDECMEQE
jgi:RHS repeat-associated protein